ncbi:GIY-YIG nuclease family protein [Methylocaldum szegediense]|uniref:Endonuclease n=1 Tax=Methylocaldum szegediense TaxID=73780 RepID=A0ABN8X123_9GAMM|nr:GIY-YIG nuclease family protein [Methylocaldum szegediense]CAI8753617.1 putative endonuclease [Methylocaldum szegediense]
MPNKQSESAQTSPISEADLNVIPAGTPESSVQDGRRRNSVDVNGTLYVGVTSKLVRRAFQHRNGLVEGFTNKYRVHMLVWFELHERMETAILREKLIKKWPRAAKIGLIEASNSEWRDLWTNVIGIS